MGWLGATGMLYQSHRYNEEFKRAMVQKICHPGGPSALGLSKEVGVSQPTLSKWVRQYGNVSGMTKGLGRRRPQDWSAEQKVKAVMDTTKMDDAELGIYLRREGLHSAHLEQWKKELVEGLKTISKSYGKPRAASEDKRKIKELERGLRRMEKALAEATALLILKKKAELIWGLVEEEEPT
jgi:transposase